MTKEKQRPKWALPYALIFFTPVELSSLNCGDYHDTNHSFYVTETVHMLALQLGRCQHRASFLAQVALIHDADPREAGTAADVRKTLVWMDRHKAQLCQRMGWNRFQFAEAQALIARTEFPYNTKSKPSEDIFDGMSPVAVYDLLLGRLPAWSLKQTMEDAQLLRFADQVANYIHDWPTASECVDGLVSELTKAGEKVDRFALNTAHFLETVCADRGRDRLVAWQNEVIPEFFSQERLVELLPTHLSDNLKRNIMRFRNERYAVA